MSTVARVPRLVITGAPASGKTVFFERLRHVKEFSGYVFFDELARRLLEETPSYRGRWAEFHREIYRRQTEREQAIAGRPFVTDRGTVDAFAFHPETVADVGTTLEAEYARYTGVIQLGSSAGLGEAYYPTDEIRRETIDEAMAIEAAISRVWSPHPAYRFVPAEPSLEEKYRRFETIALALAKEK